MRHSRHLLHLSWLIASLCAGAACSSGEDSDNGSGALGSGTGGSGSGYSTSGGPQFPGAGTGYTGGPISPAADPSTKDSCDEPPDLPPASGHTIIRKMGCFYGDTPEPDVPAATIEHVVETLNGVESVHVRVTFNPNFVDNSYGANAIGWGGDTAEPAPGAPPNGPGAPPAPGGPMGGKPKKGKGGHTFKDLVGSDHVELKLTDGAGNLAMHFRVDYISEEAGAPCGYGTLGVTGGEGKMFVGNAGSVLASATSLDRNLNGCGYCYTEDSPATDASYTPNSAAPKWDYRVVYEVWIDAAAFGSSGFGGATVESVHASPSKLASNTVEVVKKPCPPDWDVPACPSGSCNPPGTGGSYGTCPPGYVPDLASEGRYCVPAPQ